MADQRRNQDQRPSPEALLEAARREEGRLGKLKIFMGAAPGVGKTYEMLQQARARKKDGDDIVVGVVETHGRKETEALLDDLEVIPRRVHRYKGQHSRRWTSTPSSPANRSLSWSTNSLTPMCRAAATPNAISTSKSC